MALAALGLAAVWAPAQAGAAPPTSIDVTYISPDYDESGELVFPAICPFPVKIEVEGKTKTIVLPSGNTIITAPGQTTTVTNLATGETLDLKISGTSKTLDSGAVVFRGANLIIRSTVFGDDTNGLLFVTGRYTFDPAATPRLSGAGGSTDICAALA